MSKMIFVNLPVRDLGRAVKFYESIGATKNPRFSDDTAACMVLSETIHVMLLTHAKFMHFSPKPIADAKACEVLLCVSVESRAEVDATMEKVTDGRIDPTPADDYGFMYGRSLEDPDGHLWQVMWMDVSKMPPAAG